jgi:hypothetical protein
VTPGPSRYINTVTITRRVLGNSTDVGANISPMPGAEAFSGLAAADAGVGASAGDGSAGSASGGGAGGANTSVTSGPGGTQDVGTETVIPLSSRKSKTPLRLGTLEETQIDVTDETEVTVTQIVKRLRGSSGGASPVVGTLDPHPNAPNLTGGLG